MNNYTNENVNTVFKKTNTSISDIKNNLIPIDDKSIVSNLKTIDDFNLHHLINLKKFNYNGEIYGIIHVQMQYFYKKSNYDFIIEHMDKKIIDALNISMQESSNRKLFALLDLSNITQKNFSRKFIRLLVKEFNDKYDDCLGLCYLHGNFSFVKIVWPFISTLLDSKTKKKLVLLK